MNNIVYAKHRISSNAALRYKSAGGPPRSMKLRIHKVGEASLICVRQATITSRSNLRDGCGSLFLTALESLHYILSFWLEPIYTAYSGSVHVVLSWALVLFDVFLYTIEERFYRIAAA